MALHNEILREILAGRVPFRFKIRDLKRTPGTGPGRYKVDLREYSENAINTIPRNHSVCPDGSQPGDYMQKGRKPAFFWYGGGDFELILDHSHTLQDVSPEDEEFDASEGDNEVLVVASGRGARSPLSIQVNVTRLMQIAQHEPEPATVIVRYIAEEPFQAHYRGQPLGPLKSGWGERLLGYFWPRPDHNWPKSSKVVDAFSDQIQRAIAALEADPRNTAAVHEVLTAFEEVCLWGRVRLPESNPFALSTEVLRCCRALCQGAEPPSNCRLNSAWTKLYAFAIPDKCVIYDSRVAAAITSILDPVMHIVSQFPDWRSYAELGTIPGRGGSRPRPLNWNWRKGYGVWASQMAANGLCNNVVAELNKQSLVRPNCRKFQDSSPWTLREVEAVLFMEGY